MSVPHILQNGPGNWPDAVKFMDNYDFLESIVSGSNLANSGFESWGNGTTFSNPANGALVAEDWEISKAGTALPTCNVSRDITIKDTGTYSCKMDITVAGSGDSYVGITQENPNYGVLSGKTVLVGARVKTSAASKVRVHLFDGATSVYSQSHTGGGGWENLYIYYTVPASPTKLRLIIEVFQSDFTGQIYIDSAFFYVCRSGISDNVKANLSKQIDFFNMALNVRNALGSPMQAVKASRFGSSSSSPCLVLGTKYNGTTVAINYDPIKNTSGSFTGDGRELLLRNGFVILTPNSAETGFHKIMTVTDGNVSMESAYNQTTASAANVNVDATGNLKRSTSSARYKTDIKPYEKGMEHLEKLNPVSFKSLKEEDGREFAGLIAEEVDALGMKEFVEYDKDGRPDALYYQNMIALLINSVKELKARLDKAGIK